MKSKTVIHHINRIAQLHMHGRDKTRYSMFPIMDEEVFRFYNKQESNIWTAKEIDYIMDRQDYRNLPEPEKRLIDLILGFFSPGDGLIIQNIVFRFLLECETFEEMSMFITQMFIEQVHAETYGMFIICFEPDADKRERIFKMVETHPCVEAKAAWIEKYMLSDTPKADRYVAAACAEGIFFCVLFAPIFWFRSFGIFQALIHANILIAKDESLHRDFNAFLYRREVQRMQLRGATDSSGESTGEAALAETVYRIVDEAVQIEMAFADALLPEPIKDLSAAQLKLYAQSVADDLLHQLGHAKRYNVINPLTWMNDISMPQKGNMHEVRIGEYRRFNLQQANDWRKRAGLKEATQVDVYQNPELFEF